MAETKPKAKPKNTSGRVSFPQRVYNVLKLAEENHQEHILSWVSNGTAFKVHELEEFERELLPKYFNTQKYTSFTRTLCAYGFDCVRTGRQTGIYSHPKFNRNDTAALSLIKRVKNNKTNTSKGAISNSSSSDAALEAFKNRLSNLKYGIRDGNRTIMFPSLLDNPSVSNHQNGMNPSVFGQLYQTVRSQVAHRTTKALVRLPPSVELISPHDSSDDDSLGQQSPNPVPLSSSSFRMSATSNITILGQQNHQTQVSQNYGAIIDNNVAPVPLSSRADFASEQEPKAHPVPQEGPDSIQDRFHAIDDLDPIPWSPQHDGSQDNFDPIPWSPQHTPQDNTPSLVNNDELWLSSLEPRSIQNMREQPDDLNGWYNATPVVPKPKYQALYDMSSPIALPGLFYYMDISTFGMYWANFLIVGHTIQALYTAFGPNTENLVLSPKISMLKHHFMDIMWMHTLLSAMVLVPDYFGSSSVMLGVVFLATQPLNLAVHLKTHYSNKGKKGEPYIPGEWWVADIVRWIFVGYMVAILSICLGYYFGIGLLIPVGVFLVNLTPLFACQSYRLLLSIPSTGLMLQDSSDKKRN